MRNKEREDMMKSIKAVCFDLDDTLIRDIHSVMYLSILNNNLDKLMAIEEQEMVGHYNWIEADYMKAELAKGVSLNQIKEQFEIILKPLKNVKRVMECLHKRNIKTILITAGPIQVAKVASELWGISDYNGSLYECEKNLFTGKIISHLGDEGKIGALKLFCEAHGIKPEECMAIGDGSTDIPLFKYCGASIGINCAEKVAREATYTLQTEDLMDILSYIRN